MPLSNYQVLINEFKITRVTIWTKHLLVNSWLTKSGQKMLKTHWRSGIFTILCLIRGPQGLKYPILIKFCQKTRIKTRRRNDLRRKRLSRQNIWGGAFCILYWSVKTRFQTRFPRKFALLIHESGQKGYVIFNAAYFCSTGSSVA